MVKSTYVDKNGVKKGAWSEEEDNKLRAYILRYGHWNWRLLPKFAGLERCGKSCRLRWMNYLKPGLKRGNYSEEERDLIAKLHNELGNKWSAIAAKLPGRTDNDIKNYCHTHLQKREKGTSRSGQQENLEKAFAGRDVTSGATKLCSRKLRKSAVSSDVFILESSNSNSADVDWDSPTSVDKNCLGILSIDSGETDDSGNFSDLLSGFHERFWTQPFTVDAYSYNHDFNFCVLDEGGLLSPNFPYFDDNAINMF